MVIYRSQHPLLSLSSQREQTKNKTQTVLNGLKKGGAIALGVGFVVVSGGGRIGAEERSGGDMAIAQTSPSIIITQSTPSTASSTLRYVAPSQTSFNTNDLADRGAPADREAAGTRGTCALDPTLPELTVLSPTVDVVYGDESISTPLDITTLSHPTFQFYMPYTTTSVDAVQLTLLDEADDLMASIDVEMSETPGILSVPWPLSQDPLSLDVNHRWLLRVDCPGRSLGGAFETDLVAEGFIRRIALTPEQARQLETASPLEQIRLWASFGIWNEALEALVRPDSSGAQPNSDRLKDLLESVDLDALLPHF